MDQKIKLYLVATPIGNLGDMSHRAIEVLKSVDFIAAEDTRKTIKLMNYFEIKKPLISYHEHNKRDSGEGIIKRITDGQVCAVVTDAGMPAISDPGEDIVKLCIENNIKFSAIPGPCAAVTALSLSGLATGRFCFEGFLNTSKSSRREHLKSLLDEKRTMIFYEAPHKLKNTLIDMYKAFGNRKITLARELTKLYEELRHTTLEEAATYYQEVPPRGEFVLIIEGAQEKNEEKAEEVDIKAIVNQYIQQGFSKSDAIKMVANELKLRKNDVYSAVVLKEV